MITGIDLFEQYTYLKTTILSICESKSIININEDIKKIFVLQYRDFILN